MEIKNIAKSFIDFLQFEKRYSRHTIISYETDIKQLIDYLKQVYQVENIQEVKHTLVRSWIASMMEAGISSRSVNRKITAVKSLFKYLLKTGVITSNPLNKLISPKVSKKLPVFVEKTKMDQLLDDVIFDEGFGGVRDKLIIELFYQTGVRLTELINLQLVAYDRYKSTIKVLGKRNKERIIPVSPGMSEKIKQYLSERSKLNVQVDVEYFFLTNEGKKLYEKFVYRLVNNYLAKVSTISKKSPHVLRHTFATHMLNNGADLNAIKEILGHANLSATQVYTHNTIEKLKEVYKQAHPKA